MADAWYHGTGKDLQPGDVLRPGCPRMTREAADQDYRMQHQGPDEDDGEALHEIGTKGTYPDDVLRHPDWYGAEHSETREKLNMHAGRPYSKVTVYRSLPSPHRAINSGDWVATAAAYARNHGRDSTDPKKDWPVMKAIVRADQIRSDGNSLEEWSYHGPDVKRAQLHFPGGEEHRGKSGRGRTDSMPHEHEPPEMQRRYSEMLTRARVQKKDWRGKVDQWNEGKGEYPGQFRYDEPGQHEAVRHEAVSRDELPPDPGTSPILPREEWDGQHTASQRQPSPHGHGGWLSEREGEEPRCTTCGHRVKDPVTGQPPVETRYLGPRAWMKELPGRARARHDAALENENNRKMNMPAEGEHEPKYEKSNRGAAANTSAIAFHPHQAQITDHHQVDEPCSGGQHHQAAGVSHWQHRDCGVYAKALTDADPGLRIGAVAGPHSDPAEGHALHWFAHDDTHAYDSLGRHKLPYINVWDSAYRGYFPPESHERMGFQQVLDVPAHHFGELSDEERRMLPAARRHIREHATLEGRSREDEASSGPLAHQGVLEHFEAGAQGGGPFYHATSHELTLGEHLRGNREGYSYVTPSMEDAHDWAKSWSPDGWGHVHEVHPEGELEDDENWGGAYKTRGPVKVGREMTPAERGEHRIAGFLEHFEAGEHGYEIYRHGAWMPGERIFGPTYGLDRRLFRGRRMRPRVRRLILARLNDVLEPLLGAGWQDFTRVYLAGSEASEWTGPDREGNGDFDTLLGFDFSRLRQEVPGLADRTDLEICDQVNNLLKAQYNESHWHPAFLDEKERWGREWDLTGFANSAAWDIRDIHPYAAWDMTSSSWAVRPPHLPAWTPDQFPAGPALMQEARAVAAQVRAILRLPEPYRTQEATALWDKIHTDRTRAFSGPQAQGWQDPGNVIEKFLDQHPHHLLDKLRGLKFATATADFGDHQDKSRLYLRFGHWPESERSENHVMGGHEEGVSVYDLDRHGSPEDPDPHSQRGHQHEEGCEPDCDMGKYDHEDYGNDTKGEMLGRVNRAERGRASGREHPADTGHLVKGDMVGLGHDAEPLLNNVKRVGDWIDHRHLLIPGAQKHRLARDEYDEDYRPPPKRPQRRPPRTAAAKKGAAGDYRYEHLQPESGKVHWVNAYHPDGHRVGDMTWHAHGDHHVTWVAVYDEEDRRKGIATGMWNKAREVDPQVSHNTSEGGQTGAGRSWAQTTSARTAEGFVTCDQGRQRMVRRAAAERLPHGSARWHEVSHMPMYHGTHIELGPGDLVEPGHESIWTDKHSTADRHVFFTPDNVIAYDYALSAAKKRGLEKEHAHVYEVEPTGLSTHDPEYPGEMKSRQMPLHWRSKHPLRVIREASRKRVASSSKNKTAAAANQPCHFCGDPLDDEDVENESSAHQECEELHNCPVHGEHDDSVTAEQHRDTYTDWGQHLPFDHGIHRGFPKQLPNDVHQAVHDKSVPVAARADVLRKHLHENPFTGGLQEQPEYGSHERYHEGRLGVHWTPSEEGARSWAVEDYNEGPRGGGPKPSVTHIVLHAQSPHEGDIETDPDKLEERHMYGFDHERSEHEVPLRYGAPVHLTGMSWKRGGEDEWAHHNFPGPEHHIAAAAEGYVTCGQGHSHWGEHGAAGLLIRHRGDDGLYSYLLQKRAPHVDHGGTWSTPGGALHPDETPIEGARREATEELGKLPALRHHHTCTDDHGGDPGWKYHTVVQDSPERFTPGGHGSTGHETAGYGWFTSAEMRHLPLHPGFEKTWATVRNSRTDKTAVIQPGSLPERQQSAFDVEDLRSHRRQMLDVARNPEPGTRVWRGELRPEGEHPSEATSVGMHWSVNPDSIIGRADQRDHWKASGLRPVVWQGVVENHEEQAFPRSHPMWHGRHESFGHEAEVRFRPGARVRLEGAYTHDPPAGNPHEHNYLVPQIPERTSPNWKWHKLDHHVTIAHKPGDIGSSDYSDVGIPKEGSADGKEYYRVHDASADPAALLKPENQVSESWHPSEVRCPECKGAGLDLHPGWNNHQEEPDTCVRCGGDGTIEDPPRRGVSVTRSLPELASYFERHQVHPQFYENENVVSLRGHLSEDEDHDAPEAELVHPARITSVRPVREVPEMRDLLSRYDHEGQYYRRPHEASLHQAAGSGMMVALVPSSEVLDHLQEVMRPLGRHEPEARDQMHVTVLYLGKESDHAQAELDKLPELIRLWAKTTEPFTAAVQGSGTFANSGEHPLIALVDIPGEARHLHHSLTEYLKGHGISFPENHSWIPHVTMSYSPHEIRFLPRVERHSWPVNEIHYVRNKKWQSFPLGR